MENQGKRLLLAVALALGAMMIFNMIWGEKPKPDDAKKTQGSGSQVVHAPPAAPQFMTDAA